MTSIKNLNISVDGEYLKTNGLIDKHGFEIILLIKKKTHEKYLEVFNYLISYIKDSKKEIIDGQTIAYHSWLLKFIQNSKNYFSIYEVTNSGNDFIEGVELAIEIIDAQMLQCDNFKVRPLFPTFSQMIVISKGVLDGCDVNAVRYPSPSHMTGWWLTTDLYDGNVNSLETIHYFHVVFKRPDVVKYMALPFGFRFFSGEEGGEQWFDADVLL